jgi:hypothetical protein
VVDTVVWGRDWGHHRRLGTVLGVAEPGGGVPCGGKRSGKPLAQATDFWSLARNFTFREGLVT